ncbi:MAG: ABC-2 type transporter [Chloroflexi bacterium OLB14]|nr:MAG: ABC-2 type transporter [Chloroflexi bacterium OLB14]
MFNKLKPIWLVAKRELKDQLRDWRVLMPMIILTLCFPYLMNVFASEFVDFLNQFDANLLRDRLVPFSILIIGFFPITVSLVVALEAFVGEKERGTIEPLLSAPLDDWQLYFGKLLVGVITPLIASYTSIILYLLLASRLNLTIPPASELLQLFLLTTAHAVLMVSAAIVISVQSTSVKAANLLASFIVIPVAILMQGEAVMLFWGNDQVLWYGIAGVLLISLLLIRVGISHFQREYLLGREIDSINLKWIVKTFISNFTGEAKTLKDWYQHVLGAALQRVLPALFFVTLIAGVCIWASYAWIKNNVADMVATATPEEITDLKESISGIGELPDLSEIQDHLSASFLFLNNTRAVAVIFLAGMVSFSVLGIMLYMLNISLIGGLFALLELLGTNPLPIFFSRCCSAWGF